MNNSALEKYLIDNLHIPQNIDAKVRKEYINDDEITIFFLSSLVSGEYVIKLIESLALVDFKGNSINKLAVSTISSNKEKRKILLNIYEGNAIVLFKNEEKCLICEIKKYPSRGINEPEVEKSVRGSKDAFSDILMENIGLIRRRIKSPSLMIESYVISSKSQMNGAMLYITDAVNKNDLKVLKQRINNLKLDSLIMTDKALEESIFKQKYHLVPLVRYTERPDVASINLIKGKIVILIDTCSNVLITPISIFDHLKNVEEYQQNVIVGSFTKTLRFMGTIISIYLVPLFIVLTLEENYENGIIKTINIANDTPLLMQVGVVTIILEIIRIAIVHTPNALITSISLLAAIVLGDIAIDLKLFSPEILLCCSLSTICNFATPSYELSLSNRICSILMIVFTCIFGIKGFVITNLLLFLIVVNIRVLNLPYLYPIIPFDAVKFGKMFLRKSNKRKR